MNRALLVGLVVTALLASAACAAAPPRAAPAAPAASAALAVEEVVPGKLRVRVYATHLLPEGEGWTYVTDGLAALGNAELVATLRRRPGEAVKDFPRDLFSVLGAMHAAIAHGQAFDAWSIGGARGGLFGRPDWTGLIAVPADAPPGVTLPPGTLTLLAMTEAETRVATSAGAARIANMLGLAYRFYPVPWWNDRERQELPDLDAARESLLLRTHGGWLGGAGAFVELAAHQPDKTVMAGRLRLHLDRAAAKQLAGELAGDTAGVYTVLLAPDPVAEGRLVFMPLANHPGVITADPAHTDKVAGNFVILAHQASGEVVGGAAIEDGFMVVMSDADWKRLLDALRDGQPFELAGTKKAPLGFALLY